VDEAQVTGVERSTGVPPAERERIALHHRPTLIASVAALIGLGMGVILGRATAPASGMTAEARAQLRSAFATAPGSPPLKAQPASAADVYQLHLGRHLPGGRIARGFVRRDAAGRPVAGLAESENTLHFDLEASAGDYAFTAILGLDGRKTARLQSSLDGQPLSSWALAEGWAMYYSPISRDRLAGADFELAFSAADPAERGAVSVDSIAVFPITNRVSFSMGREADGHLIDGFCGPEGESAWSDGPRSAIGVVLAPSAAPYRLTVRGSALGPLQPLDVRGSVNGSDIGSVSFSAKTAESSWKVPANVLHAGSNRIEFQYAKTGRPAEFDAKSHDKRSLAVRFGTITLAPEQ
jgi:hypothetical protein